MAIFADVHPLGVIQERTIRYLEGPAEAGLHVKFVSNAGQLAQKAMVGALVLCSDPTGAADQAEWPGALWQATRADIGPILRDLQRAGRPRGNGEHRPWRRGASA